MLSLPGVVVTATVAGGVTHIRTYAPDKYTDCQLLAIYYLHSTKHLLDFTLRINNTNHDTINFSVIKYICTELFNQSIDYKYFVTPRRSSSSNSGSSSSSSWRQTHLSNSSSSQTLFGLPDMCDIWPVTFSSILNYLYITIRIDIKTHNLTHTTSISSANPRDTTNSNFRAPTITFKSNHRSSSKWNVGLLQLIIIVKHTWEFYSEKSWTTSNQQEKWRELAMQ